MYSLMMEWDELDSKCELILYTLHPSRRAHLRASPIRPPLAVKRAGEWRSGPEYGTARQPRESDVSRTTATRVKPLLRNRATLARGR